MPAVRAARRVLPAVLLLALGLRAPAGAQAAATMSVGGSTLTFTASDGLDHETYPYLATNGHLRIEDLDGIALGASGCTSCETLPPHIEGPVLISGQPTVGMVLTCSTPATSGGTPTAWYTYWERCDVWHWQCEDIPGAEDPSYRLTAEDRGALIQVVVYAGNAAGYDGVVSDPTALIGVPDPPSEPRAPGPPPAGPRAGSAPPPGRGAHRPRSAAGLRSPSRRTSGCGRAPARRWRSG